MHFFSIRVYYVHVNFVRVKSCIALIPWSKVIVLVILAKVFLTIIIMPQLDNLN